MSAQLDTTLALPQHDWRGALDALLARLDPEQRAAASWRPSDGNLRVVASAGSGKTSLLTALCARLVRDGDVAPEKLVLTTFTAKGAREMTARLSPLMDYAAFQRMRVGTFHALGLRVLRAADPARWDMARCLDLGARGRAPDVPAAAALWRAVVEYGEIPGLERPSLKIDGADARTYMREVGLLRARCVDDPKKVAPAEAKLLPDEFRPAWRTYEEAKRALRAWDFDDALAAWRDGLASGTFAPDADVCAVDEAQDQNKCQLEIAKLLARDGRLILVGDGSQTIYEFRGAFPDLFLRADKEIGARTLSIQTNYRSGQAIVDLGNRIVEGRAWSLDTRARSHRGDVSQVQGFGFADDSAEADWIAQHARAQIDAGARADEFLVLARTNAALGTLQAAMTQAQVPHAVLGGSSLFDHREAMDVLCYLLLSEQDALPALERVLNRPKRFLRAEFAREVERCLTGARTLPEAIVAAAMVGKPHARGGAGRLAQDIRDLRRHAWPAVVDHVERFLVGAEEEDEDGDARTRDPDDDRPGIYRAACGIARRFPGARDYIAFADRCMAAGSTAREDAALPAGKLVLSTVHKCVAPDTLVECDAGLLRMDEIAHEGTIATAVGPLPYGGFVAHAERDMLRITTRRGYEITVTPDHGMYTWDRAAGTYVRREAHELRKGGLLRLKLGCQLPHGAPPPLPPPTTGDVREHTYPTPLVVNDDLAEFLGLMVADGTIWRAGFRLVKRHRDVVERFAELSTRLFRASPVVGYGRHSAHAFHAEVSSRYLARWLLQIDGLAPKQKAIPRLIRAASLSTQARFLRGLFEDGTVNVKGTHVDHVAFATMHAAVAHTVQVMLLRFGIVSSVRVDEYNRTQDDRPVLGWRVTIAGQDALRFRDAIGFISAFKQGRLLRGSFGPEIQSNPIPVARNDARLREHEVALRNGNTRGTISRATARKIGGFSAELAFFHDPIRAIERVRAPACCVEVPGAARFLQNGFDGANCKGLERPTVIVSASEGMMPHWRACPRDASYDEAAWRGPELEAEVRLFYVAVTRARDRLVLTWSHQERGRGRKFAGPSRFIARWAPSLLRIEGSE